MIIVTTVSQQVDKMTFRYSVHAAVSFVVYVWECGRPSGIFPGKAPISQ